MNLRASFGLSIVALVFFGGAASDPSFADPLQAGSPADQTLQPSIAPSSQTAETIAQVATVTEAASQIAATTEIVVPAPAETAPPPVASAADEPALAPAAAIPSSPPPKPYVPAAKLADKTRLALKSDDRVRSEARRQRGEEGQPKVVQVAPVVRTIGQRQVGQAAWYGGRYVGRRTSSGERLDRVNPTAAHRTLPLNSLARVTNLDNGRSVIVRVTDRGPVSESLVIDVSPKAAEQLDMKTAGIARVMIEQVVAVTDAK